MILKISLNNAKVLRQDNLEIIMRVKPNDPNGPTLFSVKGETAEDFDDNDALHGAYLLVGERGAFGLSRFR